MWFTLSHQLAPRFTLLFLPCLFLDSEDLVQYLGISKIKQFEPIHRKPGEFKHSFFFFSPHHILLYLQALSAY